MNDINPVEKYFLQKTSEVSYGLWNTILTTSGISRIYYVAFSRAKEKLFVTVPEEFTKKEKEKLETKGFDINYDHIN